MTEELVVEHIRDTRPGYSGQTLCGSMWEPAPDGLAWTCGQCVRLFQALRPIMQAGTHPRMR